MRHTMSQLQTWGEGATEYDFFKSQVEQLCSNNQIKVFDINVQMSLDVLHISQEKEKTSKRRQKVPEDTWRCYIFCGIKKLILAAQTEAGAGSSLNYSLHAAER